MWGNSPSGARCGSRRAVGFFPFCLLAILALSGCGGKPDGGKAARIVLGPEILLAGAFGHANDIAEAPDGIYVIAGAMVSAWAIGVDTRTKRILWRYDQPREWTKAGDQSDFSGVVRLANGNFLFCGHTTTDSAAPGLVAILDPQGQLVEERKLVPTEDPSAWSLARCIPWQDGVALVGYGTSFNHKGSRGWVTRLDRFGHKEWERFLDGLPARTAVESPWGDLIVTGGLAPDTKLIRIDRQGDVVGQRGITSPAGLGLISSPANGGKQYVIAYSEESASLHVLNEELEEINPPKKIPLVFVDRIFDGGRGYVLSDGSLALFGSIPAPRGTLSAAIGRVNSSTGAIEALHHYDAWSVRGAAPLAANSFVALHEKVTEDPKQHGAVISWITFE